MDSHLGRAPLLAFTGFTWFFAMLLSNAWISDDVYIGYRSMEQLLAGNGPVWNAHERVQIYTSVAWFWLGYLVRQVTDDYFLLMLFMSTACCAAMLALLRRWVANDAAWLVLVLALTASRGLVDFSTSGLEFPMVCMLAVAVMISWRKVAEAPTPAGLARLLMLASVVPLVRHDMVLLVAPACLHAMWVGRRCMSPGRWCLMLCAAALPLLCWTAFALAYYGFPLPNTFYAKAARGIPNLELVQLGLGYYQAVFLLDPATPLLIIAGIALMLRAKLAPLAAGVALHLAYVLWVGGDFMLTRLLVADYVVAVSGAAVALLGGVGIPRYSTRAALVMLVVSAAAVASAWYGILVDQQALGAYSDAALSPATLLFVVFLWALMRKVMRVGQKPGIVAASREGLLAAVALLVFSYADPYSPAMQLVRSHSYFGVYDEQGVYADDTSFAAWANYKSGLGQGAADQDFHDRMAIHSGLPAKTEMEFPLSQLAVEGRVMGRMFDVATAYAVGMQGWAAGTDFVLIDMVGLGDAYLARTWFDGDSSKVVLSHWYAQLPRKYALRLVDGPTAGWGEPGTFEGDLELAVRSDELFTARRWAAIARLNLGLHGVVEVREPINPNGGTHRTPLLWHHDARVWIPKYEDSRAALTYVPIQGGF